MAEEIKVESGDSTKNRLKRVFVADHEKSLSDFIIFDCLAPAIKDIIVETINKSVHYFAYGTDGPSRRITTLGHSNISVINTNKTGYSIISPSSSVSKAALPVDSTAKRLNYDIISFPNIEMAKSLRDLMCDQIMEYPSVSVNDYYDYAQEIAASNGMSISKLGSYATAGYGWTDLSKCVIQRNKDGWYLYLPPAEYLGK